MRMEELGRQREQSFVNGQIAPRLGGVSQYPSTDAESPLRGHMHQTTRLDVPKDIFLTGLMCLSSASHALQRGDIKPDVCWEEGYDPWQCWDFSKHHTPAKISLQFAPDLDLTSFVDAPTTGIACIQREMNFAQGKAEKGA